MSTHPSDLLGRLRAQPPLVRVFVYMLLFALVLKGIDVALDFTSGFYRGFMDGSMGR